MLNLVKDIAKKNSSKAYVVGGWIRDSIMNTMNIQDIDIVFDKNVDKIVKDLINKGYNVFTIKEEAGIYRWMKEDKIIDLTSMKGKNIYEDLKKRDYTINAIAKNIETGEIIDPFNGIKDINNKIIRVIDEKNIKEDRIRILRGIRFSIKYSMKISKNTENIIKNESMHILKCPKERIFNEFMNILKVDKKGEAFNVLDNYGILKEMLPYIPELKNIGKCKYHKEDAFTHMITTYKVYKKLVNEEIQLKGLNMTKLNSKISNFYIKDYLALAAFCHDIGKVKAYKVNGEKVSFINHEKEGEKIIKKFCEDIIFPKKANNIICDTVLGHMYPLGLFKNNVKHVKKAYYKFFNKFKENSLYILYISFCDIYATNIFLNNKEELMQYKIFIEKMIKEYDMYKDIKEKRIIRGNEIIDNFIIKEKYIGKLLECIDEERYEGKITNKEEVIKFIENYYIKK